MSNQVIANFSDGLFQLAKDENNVALFKSQIQEIEKILQENPKWIELMSSFSIENTEKKQLIDKAFADRFHPYIINFLKLMVDKERFHSCIQILQEFILLCNNEEGILQGIVYSGFALDETSVKALEKAFSEKLEKEVSLRNKVDADLIAGVRVEIDHEVYDNTLKSKVEQLRKEMLSRE